MSANVFEDQRQLMDAFGHSTAYFNYEQFCLLQDLVDEEQEEFEEAMSKLHAEHMGNEVGVSAETLAEVIDALMDSIVVRFGAICSLGVDSQGAWDAVYKSNMTKVGADGKVAKDANGKVVKGPGFVLPDLLPLAEDALAA